MDRYDEGYREYTSDPLFPTVEAIANAKGYRKATAAEVRASADSVWHAPDLFSAYGGLWVRVVES
ncbi:MAG: hypothetical protein J5X22_20970 [Candidatus Accumulibacter sp.]|uniref:hypothetical protein n=1 Tax=Accumulibacter sp. TaxID=2053492 RepID=UPI001AD10535|nr:hypothetical protein [Accumulibacter sp.]MBN8516627.1 hypothetical protein [Accumulibacter sp.]MBO3712867.1 hypothetical protein [Accumulibacter sp.]